MTLVALTVMVGSLASVLTPAQAFASDDTDTSAAPVLRKAAPRRIDVKPIDDASLLLNKLEPITYRIETPAYSPFEGYTVPRELSEPQFEFTPKNVQEVFPGLVENVGGGVLGISYDGFIPILVEAFQQLQKTVEQQAIEIQEQAAQIKRLQTALEEKQMKEGASE